VTESTFSTERRQSQRLRAQCEAELIASVTLLDAAQPENGTSTLVFMAETQDISAHGLALVLPSIRIDEKYCEQPRSLKLSLHLPDAAVELEVNAIRCVPLNVRDPGQGYLIGARINDISRDSAAQLETYLENLSNEPH
jgi:hypothetical protein